MLLKILTWGKIKVIFKILSLSGKSSTLITSHHISVKYFICGSFLISTSHSC